MTPEIIVQLENASIARDKKVMLRDLNLSLAQAEFCYLIGKTGSGKSTLLKTLYGAIPLWNGKGIVAGFELDNVNHQNKPALRRKLGMIFQNFLLFNDWTVFENLGYILKATDWHREELINNRIDEVLDFTNLLHKKQWIAGSLSGGEQQRVAIARAILNKPVLLIADEPTGNLDPESSDEILYLLRDLTYQHKMTTIFATHEYRLIKKFPARVFECENQTITER